MKNTNWITFRIVSWSVLLVSLVIQALSITYRWWDFDPRLSCERLVRWDEWISCMHSHSHLYVSYFELAVGAWLAAGIAASAARMLPPYISVIAPGGVIALWFWEMTNYWNEDVVPYAIIHYPFEVPTPTIVLSFAVTAGYLAAYMVAPVAAAWLLGFQARTRRRLARQQKLANA